MSAPTGPRGTVRRPPRIRRLPGLAKGAARGLKARLGGDDLGGGGDQFLRDLPRHRPGAEPGAGAGEETRDPVEHLVGGELGVAAGAEDRGQHRQVRPEPRPAAANIAAFSERLARPGSVGVRRSRRRRRQRRPRGRNRARRQRRATPSATGAGPRGHVEEHGGLAEEAGHPRLAEADALGRRGLGVRQQRRRRRAGGRQAICSSGRGPGLRIDREALPGDPAEHELRAQGLAVARDGKRSDDVSAAADADD